MFIRGGSARVRRPALALGLAFSTCVAVAAASHAFNSHAVMVAQQPVTLAFAGETFDALAAAPADVWIMVAPDCETCGRAVTEDAARLRAVGMRVSVLQAPAAPDSAEPLFARLLGASAEAAETAPTALLRASLAERGLDDDAPIFIWRQADGAWRCASGQDRDAADRILSELKARA